MSVIDTVILEDNYSIKIIPNYSQTLLEITHPQYRHFLIMPVILSIPELYRKLLETIFDSIDLNLNKGAELQPIIFISSISWLDSFYGYEEKKCYERQQRFIEKYSYSSFLFNSSSWIQFVELEFSNIKFNQEQSALNYKASTDHLDRLKSFNIFENPNAKEYLEYHFRLQRVNYLFDKSLSNKATGHGRHISPNIYSNEQKNRISIKMSPEINFLFAKKKEETWDHFNAKKINLRILLIDDKIVTKYSNTDGQEKRIVSQCKASLIKNLLELRFDIDKQKDVCWKTPNVDGVKGAVEIFQFQCYNTCSGCNLFTLIDEKAFNKDIKKRINSSQEDIQIIAVPNLEKARILLADSDLRFDLIMMDYLLDNKLNEKGENIDDREYGTEFWSDGSEKFFEISKKSIQDKNIDGNYDLKRKDEYLSLKETYDKIKANRGPLQRLWIFPITAFNQTFIDDLRNKGVRLIDYYWYLSRGADPINTPYLFINTLNNFLQLQILQAVFSLKTVVAFLKKSCEDIEKISDAEVFQAHMGSEYTVLIQKHGWRPVISRDAKAGSLFSKHIWENFYSKTENKFLFRLMDKMQKFFHVCTYADKTDYDKMMLYWKELDIFITDYWHELLGEYEDKFDDTDLIIKPDIRIFQNKINNFLDKHKN